MLNREETSILNELLQDLNIISRLNSNSEYRSMNHRAIVHLVLPST